jgi:uncharacterized protein
VARAVLDPNVLVSALISPSGPSAGLLAELRSGAFEVVTSPLLLAELENVLLREKFRRYISETEVEAFVDLVRRESVLVDDPEPSSTPESEDPGDEYLIALARAERTDALVSGDPHLLRLRRLIPVKTPREYLDEERRSGLAEP